MGPTKTSGVNTDVRDNTMVKRKERKGQTTAVVYTKKYTEN
jgi:hypothetical protein